MKVLASALLVSSLYAVPAFAFSVPHHGDSAPAFDLPRLGGGKVSLDSLRGKPIYLNFFASWCAPCNEEAPSIVALYRKYRARGLLTLGIDEQEDKSKAGGFVKKYTLPYNVALDDDGKMGQSYGAVGLPIHVFIDKSGKISTYRLGQMEPTEIEAAIRKIL